MAVREVRPNSIAQLFEQAVRIGVVACALHAVDAQDITRSCAAVVLGNTISEISSTVHPHPTVSEAVMEAAHACHGNSVHAPKARK